MNFKAILFTGLAYSLSIATVANAIPAGQQGGPMTIHQNQGQGVTAPSQPSAPVVHPAPVMPVVHPAPVVAPAAHPAQPHPGQQPARPVAQPAQPAPAINSTNVVPVTVQNQTELSAQQQANQTAIQKVNASGNAAAFANGGQGGNAENTIGIGTESTLTGGNVNTYQGPQTATANNGGIVNSNSYESKIPVPAQNLPGVAPVAPLGSGSTVNMNYCVAGQNVSYNGSFNSAPTTDSVGGSFGLLGFAIGGGVSNSRQVTTKETVSSVSQQSAERAMHSGMLVSTTGGYKSASKMMSLIYRASSVGMENVDTKHEIASMASEMEQVDLGHNPCHTLAQPTQPIPTGTPDWNTGNSPWPQTVPAVPSGSEY